MTATFVPAPPVNVPVVDVQTGLMTRPWIAHVQARHQQAGGSADKIEAATVLANAASPASAEVVAVAGLHLGGAVGANVAIGLYRALDLAANLPTTGNLDGDLAYATNGRKPGEGAGAGTGVPCFWTLGAWYALTSGAAVTA